jgi:hypothetical protein
MKRCIVKAVLVAAITLPALSNAGWAQKSNDFGYSNATPKRRIRIRRHCLHATRFAEWPATGLRGDQGLRRKRAFHAARFTAASHPSSRRRGKKGGPILSIRTARAAMSSN